MATVAKAKGVYDWAGNEPDCPDDIVVCIGSKPLILGSENHPCVKTDGPRIEAGDRRQGAYYLSLVNLPVGTGLTRLKTVSQDRLLDLEKRRQVRTGERPADWVLEARARAKAGHDPKTYDNIHMARAHFGSAAGSW